jgi:hypothetical protein
MTDDLNLESPDNAPQQVGSTADLPPAPEPARQPCPYCGEAVLPQARRCPHCTEYLDKALADAARPRPLSRLAVSSFVMALFAPLALFITGPVAVVLGLLALKSPRTRGKGLAAAGVLLGLACSAALVFIILDFVQKFQETQLGDPGPLF